MLNRRVLLVCALLSVIVLSPTDVHATVPNVSGTYQTPSQQGTITFKPIKRIVQFGYEGTFKVGGKSYPGSIYFPRSGGVGMVWYYGVSGIMAGNALGTLQSDGVTYSGPIFFFDRKGNTIDSGTTTFK